MMKKPQEAQQIHKMVFEALDKELRKIPLDQVEIVKSSDDMRKDQYPLTVGIMKIVRKFDLGERFFYDSGKCTYHFTVQLVDDGDGSKLVVVSFK